MGKRERKKLKRYLDHRPADGMRPDVISTTAFHNETGWRTLDLIKLFDEAYNCAQYADRERYLPDRVYFRCSALRPYTIEKDDFFTGNSSKKADGLTVYEKEHRWVIYLPANRIQVNDLLRELDAAFGVKIKSDLRSVVQRLRRLVGNDGTTLFIVEHRRHQERARRKIKYRRNVFGRNNGNSN